MPLDRQTTFDTMLIHLRQQGKRAMDTDNNCVYRTPDGLKCAVGAVIPDDKYHPDMEGLGPIGVLDRDFNTGWDRDDADFLSDAQCFLHDNISDEDFQGELELAAQEFADRYQLQVAA